MKEYIKDCVGSQELFEKQLNAMGYKQTFTH